MTDPFSSESNGDLGSNPNPESPDPTPAHEQPATDPTPVESQGNPTESTQIQDSPWAKAAEAQGAGEAVTTPAQPGSEGAPTMPPPGVPPAPVTAFGQDPGFTPSDPPPAPVPPGGWAGGQGQPGAQGVGQGYGQPYPGQPFPGQPGQHPGTYQGMAGVPLPGAYPPGQMSPGQMLPGSIPPGQAPYGHIPPGQAPPGQIPPGMGTYGPGAQQPPTPKPYSPLPWLILAAVITLGILGMMAGAFFVLRAPFENQEPVVDFSEDTLSEYSEYAPSERPSDSASDAAKKVTETPSPVAPALPTTPAPEAPPADGGTYSVPDPTQIQGEPYEDRFDNAEGLIPVAPIEIAVGESREGRVGPRQMVPVKVNLKQGQKVTIAIKGDLFSDYRFWVTSPANELVGFGDDSTAVETKDISLDPNITFEAKVDGEYTILVNNNIAINESAFTISVNE